MENQQLSSNLNLIIRNAILGDGNLWKHPECKNYKMVFTSSDKTLLERKKQFMPNLFTGNITVASKKGTATNFGTRTKDLFVLASRVHSEITKYKNKKKEDILQELTLQDFALWYADDGCSILRKDKAITGICYRFMICIGSTCNTPNKEKVFTDKLTELFGISYGNISFNNGKKSVNNKTWYMPHSVAFRIFKEAIRINVHSSRFPYNWKKFRDYLERE